MGAETTSIGGALVPSVKSEPAESSAGEPSPPQSEMEQESDKDILCPICMQIIKDAFLTACGHSFCYMCIVTHLKNKSDCPCCSHFLTTNHIYPNFLLNKLLMKTSAHQIAKTATPLEQLRQALERGCEASVKDLESLMSLLSEKKSKMEQEEAETNLQILLDFMLCLRKKKLDELNEIQLDLQYIKEDIHAVEKRRIELYRRRDRYSSKLRMLGDDPSSKSAWPSVMDKHSGATASRPVLTPDQCRLNSGDLQNKKGEARSSASHLLQRKDNYGGSDTQNLTQSGLVLARKRRVHAQFNDLQDCYLQKRRYWAKQMPEQQGRDSHSLNREGYSAGLEDFQSVLSTFTRYSRVRVVAELGHGDLFHSANIVSSIEFDRDDELFATAGVSRRIKIFEFSSVVNDPTDAQCPVAEMSTRAKLSCLSWNKYAKNHIASSDYEGTVTVWDVTTRQSVMEYEEHEKRAWSVDFSRTDPSMLVSGSDDCKVKVWCTKQEASVLNIDMKANICSVKYNPGSSFHVAVGSADHHIHYYDLRKVSQPLYIFSGHRKAVSYVKFLSNHELASASTDSTLRLWDVTENVPLRTFRGHTNEKNFVGLTVNSEYIACGSETNEVFVYHKAISKPAAWHKFNSDTEEGEEDAGSYFISAVCWKSDSPTMVTANSQGTIKVLVLAP
ncbi:Transducin/WD40 repeat-like superfamily protein [Perilla frutescens var. hirtella]|uniref:Transducin/WD40 repeat-like superfamily protein n=1 Tax=Perilla frutescens var. hirtella TaxID=608512 RepID=A0AAD4IM17_PERFH|nr:Transducin/WD40 repeat-like superfamily protein [Perilla frutescens var. hirtella]KAH6777299.1 Transducin/WD40 repeat-like superfamily protein [Perilla frutescens var. frutescens]KAH6787714.1 Transducin/WD40 repeat-like superfamily protein [Perilla frutescens var. hirtella]